LAKSTAGEIDPAGPTCPAGKELSHKEMLGFSWMFMARKAAQRSSKIHNSHKNPGFSWILMEHDGIMVGISYGN